MRLLGKSRGLAEELPRYGVVIVLSFIADYIGLWYFVAKLHWQLIPSVLAAYSFGVLVNYLLSSHWVFGTRRYAGSVLEPVIFWAIAVVSAILSTLIFWVFRNSGLNLFLVKVLAEGLVAVISFGSKKLLLFSDFDGYVRVWRLYGKAPLSARLHTLVRYITLPYKRLRDQVPAETKSLLEIGAGHGLVCHLLAQDSQLKDVYGSDIDGEKLVIAERAADGVIFDTAPPKGKQFDVVLIVDVLYLLGADEQAAMIQEAFDCCRPGGVVMIKEMAQKPRWKYLVNQLQETISVKILRITDYQNRPALKLASLDRLAKTLRGEGHTARLVRLDAGYLHPHQLLIVTKGKR